MPGGVRSSNVVRERLRRAVSGVRTSRIHETMALAIGGGERNLRWRFRPTEEIVDSVRVVSPVVFAVAQAVSAPEALPEHQ